MLVSYSDSEGSEDEQPKPQAPKPAAKSAATTTPSSSNFAIDRSTGKIKVNLQNKPDPSVNGTHEDEPAAKRPRIGGGGGAFSGFNAMLPAPKRDNLPTTQPSSNKAPTRKVFSLRTGAEPAFSRESDAELRNFFAEQDAEGETEGAKSAPTIPTNIPKPSFAKPAPPAPAGKAFMFKPLSVARNTKKKKPAGTSTTTPPVENAQAAAKSITEPIQSAPDPPKKKINLFSAGTDTMPSTLAPIEPTYDDVINDNDDDDDDEDEILEDLGPASQPPPPPTQPQSLSTIANDLNLTAAERRQLFGRTGTNPNAAAANVVNFNTDAEYAANQQLIAAGEQVQHNPVRAIAGGKHSLRQLVSSAANQKEALEESFAAGRRSKKEAGSRYGW